MRAVSGAIPPARYKTDVALAADVGLAYDPSTKVFELNTDNGLWANEQVWYVLSCCGGGGVINIMVVL